jgi:CheY-like chemotaxis protein/anti-sigma regulatory factor (Ser/Thr protein kinase)
MEQNNELEMQKNQLNEASQLKTNFLSNMSHELRTPLNSVIALSGVLNRRLEHHIPEEEYSYLEVIERNGKHLLELINDILDISRIEAGREELEITLFNVNAVIADVANMIRPQARQKNVDLLFTADASDSMLTSDADKCKHILQNLVGNAVKFTEKGSVEIKVQSDEKNLTIRVIDSGIGIEESHLPHIFDEFRQADGSTSRRFGGSGLGLAIAKKYANLLGGNVSVKSEIDHGSEFTLILPLIYSEENIIVDKQKTITKSHSILQPAQKIVNDSATKTILLVEDSEPAIIQLKDFLEESGYHILVAHNGNEALQCIEYTIPDAMILDLMMPDVDGFSVLQKLRNEDRTAHIPVLILTAKHITKDDLKTLKRNNVHQLIQKGDVNREELLKAVTSMVSHDVEEIPKPQRMLQTIVGKPIVLIVEDNHDNMITVKAILGDNYRIIEAYDGKEGIELAMKHKPHLILMDIALPEVDGIQAFRAIRNDVHLSHIPIIALTASAMTSDRETILSHGFDAYLPKPINEKQFFKTINETLYGK